MTDVLKIPEGDSMIDLEELKRRYAAATQGEWVSNSCESSQRDYARITLAGKGSYVGDACENSDGVCIAAIHNAFPAIVAKLEAAESSLEEIAMLADHQIPAYAFGDNEAACDLASRMSSIYKLAAFDKEQS